MIAPLLYLPLFRRIEFPTKFDNLAIVQQKILVGLYTQRRLRSSCTSSQSDQSLRWDSKGNESTNVS